MTKLDQTKLPLFDRLLDYCKNSGTTLFDVPGHKMGRKLNMDLFKGIDTSIFNLDINSSKHMDMLNNPTGVILEAEELTAELYGSDNAFFLVNGSTGGVQSMILSSCNPNDKIIMPRNVHKSATNALILSGAVPVYLKPDFDADYGISLGVSFKHIKQAIDENPDAKALFLVCPTYFGTTIDLKRAIDYAHSKGLVVLVDESHGSHFGFHDELPINSIKLGADMATISMHKTGGSLTQSSILLYNKSVISFEKIRSIINLSQTSSANYLLLASLDIARYNFANNKSEINNLVELSNYAINQIKKINKVDCFSKEIINGDSISDFDISKLVINVAKLGTTGYKVYDLLKSEYNIQLELAETNVVLAVISIADSKETIDVLINAIRDLASKCIETKPRKIDFKIHIPEAVFSPRDAFFMEKELVSLDDSIGRISGGTLMIYPPGIPLVTPGEVISKNCVDDYRFLVNEDTIVLGSYDEVKILVIKE